MAFDTMPASIPQSMVRTIVSYAERRDQLGQLRPANTNAAAIYTPRSVVTGYITHVIISNSGVGAVTYRLFHDKDGTTYDQTTQLVWDESIAVAGSKLISYGDRGICIRYGGNFAVATGTANDLTFTAYGYEEIVVQ